MANRIKGITVEIGGDTTKLSKALEGVNKNIKNTQTQLKDVEKLLELDPSNTELLSQKHKLLADAVSATKDKLETLKTAAEQANTALANGDISQEQYDALQREIIETEQELQNLQNEAEKSHTALVKLGEAGAAIEKVGGKVADVGETLTTHVTVPIVAAGTAAVKTASDFDSAMSKVAAVSGATGDDLDALRDKAREMGAKTKFSASEAAEAMNYMAMAGWKTQDMLGGIEGIMNLAAASGEDLATTSDIVTDALTAFGLTAADSGHFADILAAASSNANTNVSMMGETFKYAAPVAGALGFSVEDTAQAIGLMANAGIKSTQAGTSLRTIMTALSGEVKFCGEKLGDVTIETTNADGSMRNLNDILADCRAAFSQLSESEAASAAQAFAGKNAMSGFLALMNAAPADIEKLNGAITTCDGTSLSMAETMQDNLGGQLTILKSQLEELAIAFGEILMPTIRKIVSHIQALVDKFNSLSPATKENIAKVALVAAALGPLLVVVGKTMVGVGKLMQVVSNLPTMLAKAKTALTSFGAAIGGISAPVVAVIAVIAALVAAFVHLWKTNEDFRNKMTAIWNEIKGMASLAQQESESLSKNTKMGIQYRFQQGKVMVNARCFLGYDKDEDGHLIINTEQAEIVKRIFREYLEGKSCKKIAQGLERDGILTSRGKPKWHDTSIRKILENEKYMGDALLQKTCTVDFLNKKRVKNTGMQPQYYVEDDHEAIIPKEFFLMVQEEMARRSEQNACFGRRKSFSANHPFSKIVFCAECGEEYRRLHWNNRGKKSIVWRCLTRLKHKDECHARTLNEEILTEAFLDALNEIVGNSDDYLTRLKDNLETAINEANPESAPALAAKMAKLQQELIDRTERHENYDDITEEILRLRELQAQVDMDGTAKSEHKKRIRELLKFIEKQKNAVFVFDEALVRKLLEKVTVYDDYLEFQFKSGVTVSVEK